MTRPSPYVIELSGADRTVLEARTRAYTAPHHQVLRARIVLLAAGGAENAAIAGRLGVSVNSVSLWRKRFFDGGLAGLKDHRRPGRPPVFPPLGQGGGGGAGLRAPGPGTAGARGPAGSRGTP